MKQYIKPSGKRKDLVVASTVFVAILIVGAALAFTHAANFFGAIEPENGTLTTNAKVVLDGSASGGKAIQFNAPAQGGGGSGGGGGGTSGSCPGGSLNTLGGSDPWGGCWPGPANTGYPHGLPGDTRTPVTLTAYSGPCIITSDSTVIDSKTINCNPLEIQAKAVIVKNSKLNGQLYINSDAPATQYNLNYSVTLQDSEVGIGTIPEPAVFEGAMTLLRDDIHGGITSVQCGDKAAQCIIQDSYLHGQLIQSQTTWHLGAFHSIGGTNYTLTHNYIVCDQPYTYETSSDSGGCSGDIVFIPYDASLPISHANVTKNFMGANASIAYCLYGGDKPGIPATYMNFSNNIFQKGGLPNGCGAYGPVAGTSATNTGNQWINNTWDTGGAVSPAE